MRRNSDGGGSPRAATARRRVPRLAHPPVPATPKVSIGLPVYNAETYLRRALDSLLGQTFQDIEIVICDNASEDRTPEICLEYSSNDDRIRYHRNPSNVGPAENFNRVFERASGEYFKWAAHDDWCAPRFLERCVAALDADPDVVLAYTGTVYVDAEGQPMGHARLLDFGDPSVLRRGHRWMRSFQVTPPAFGLIRASVLRETGLYGSEVQSEKVLLTKLILRGPWRLIPEPLLYCFTNRRSKRGTITIPGPGSPRSIRSSEGRGASQMPTSSDPERPRPMPRWRWRFLWRWRFFWRLVLAVAQARIPVHAKLLLIPGAIAHTIGAFFHPVFLGLRTPMSKPSGHTGASRTPP